MRILIFESEVTKAVYCWNGKEVITIIGAKNRPVGKVMNFFTTNEDKIPLMYTYIKNKKSFKIGSAKYNVLISNKK